MAEAGPAADAVRQAYQYCEQLVRANDKDTFIADLYAPAERRPYLFALHAFALEIGRVHRMVSEPMTGMIRLQWWLEALAGLRAEEAAANPVIVALEDAARQTGIALTPLSTAIEARQAELSGAPAIAAAAAIFDVGAHFLDARSNVSEIANDAATATVFASESRDTEKAAAGYRAFRARTAELPERALPVFLPVALVPLLLKRPDAAQWRRQIGLLRAARLGFPRL